MASSSKIEWTNASWTAIRARNKATGKVGWHCEHATTGCEFCYAEAMNLRLGTGLPFKPGHRKDIELFLDEKMLLAPLSWRKPRMIFANSMTDLFAGFVPDEWIDREFAVMALAEDHTFQVLTKRADRMRQWANDPSTPDRVEKAMDELAPEHWCKRELQDVGGWPLRNVWLGVSCERQQEADERIPDLLETPAAVRFVSAEPLLGPISFERIPNQHGWGSALEPSEIHGGTGQAVAVRPGLDWVIVGGESGRSARPMHFDWARSIVGQCKAAGVSVFVKQMGKTARSNRHDAVPAAAHGAGWHADAPGAPDGIVSFRNAKGGDPIEWPPDLRVREMPEARA